MKQFVSGGCSFSECITSGLHTWPGHVSAMLKDHVHVPTAMGSAGNGLISRRIIYTVSQLLKQHPANDILVGVMWSGPARHDYYNSEIPQYLLDKNSWAFNHAYGMENPTNVVTEKNWIILNHQWTSPNVKHYYSYFYDHIGALVYTYEHILRTQWFLNMHGIRYFMSTYTNEVFPTHAKGHNEIAHLVDQIDFDKFLPVDGEYEWCRDYSELDFPLEGDNHPSQAQHKLFAEQVVWPFLQKHNYLE